MLPRSIVLRLTPDRAGAGFSQRLADGWLLSDLPIAAGARPATLDPPLAPRARGVWRRVYDGPGLVDGRIERVVSRVAPGGERRVEFADGERYEISADGGFLHRIGGHLSLSEASARALGAPLALALALRDVHLLHASAVGLNGRALALVAPSGGGKSTLARHAVAHGLPRLADDILPVRLGASSEALPRFPQLKLRPAEEYPEDAPDVVSLGALIELAHSPATRGIASERLEPAAAAFALVRATVAARLFDEQLLSRHFAACTRAAQGLPVFHLTYPSGIERLGDVADTLRKLPLERS